MKIRNPFKRKNYASPYYGGRGALFNSSAVPLRKDETDKKPALPVVTPGRMEFHPIKPAEPDWEQRRYELARMLVLQDRRSVVLGKLKATDWQIATKARCLADATIKELQNHPPKSHDEDERERKANDE